MRTELDRDSSLFSFPNVVEWLGTCSECWGPRKVDRGHGKVKVGCNNCLNNDNGDVE